MRGGRSSSGESARYPRGKRVRRGANGAPVDVAMGMGSDKDMGAFASDVPYADCG